MKDTEHLSRTHSCHDCGAPIDDEASAWTLELGDGRRVPLCGPCGERRAAGLHEPPAVHRATCPGPGACDWPEAHDGFPG